MLLQDDFLDDYGYAADISDYEELIDRLSVNPSDTMMEIAASGHRPSEKEYIEAHPRGGLGKNVADVDFPIVVGYNLNGREQSEIAYNQDELDDILDSLNDVRKQPGIKLDIPYSLDSLHDSEAEDTLYASLDQFAEAFAPTAQEEAEKINQQAGPGAYGMTLVTDQEFWEKRGISTGEELALSVISQSYSDYHKEIHGFRPRHAGYKTVDEYSAAIDKLDDYYSSMIEQEEIDAKRRSEIDKERAELQALMPTEVEKKYDKLPTRSGMRRRYESINRLRLEIRAILSESLVR